MPNKILTQEKLLEVLYEKQRAWEKQQIISIELDNLIKELEDQDIETSQRTIYRRLQELRQNGFIQQSIGFFRKYRLEALNNTHDIIIVDELNQRVSDEKLSEMLGNNNKTHFILRDDGEIKTQLIELTPKGLKELEKSKKISNNLEGKSY